MKKAHLSIDSISSPPLMTVSDTTPDALSSRAARENVTLRIEEKRVDYGTNRPSALRRGNICRRRLEGRAWRWYRLNVADDEAGEFSRVRRITGFGTQWLRSSSPSELERIRIVIAHKHDDDTAGNP